MPSITMQGLQKCRNRDSINFMWKQNSFNQWRATKLLQDAHTEAPHVHYDSQVKITLVQHPIYFSRRELRKPIKFPGESRGLSV